MNSSWIDVAAADQGSFKAYLSLPPAGKGPGIVLIQEIFGVNDHIRAVADQYALDGYCVLAPDVFWRQQPRVELGYTEEDMDKASLPKACTRSIRRSAKGMPQRGISVSSARCCPVVMRPGRRTKLLTLRGCSTITLF